MPEIQLTCDWFDLCDSSAYGMVAHPDKGVIPVCKYHVDAFRLPVITKVGEVA